MKAVNNDTAGRGYCGPHVVAGITGEPMSKVLDAFREARYGPYWRRNYERAPGIRGTYRWEVVKAMELLGWREACRFSYLGKTTEKPTLAKWFKSRLDWMRQVHCLVEVTGHWVLVKGNKFLDTFTDGTPVNIGKAPRRRKRVHQVTGFIKA